MDLVILGSGNVATCMSLAFFKAGHRIAAVWSRNIANSTRLAEQLNAKSCENISELPAAEAYVICVSDDAIASVAEKLEDLPPDALVMHTAGSVPMNVLNKVSCRRGVIYPMQTFTKVTHVNMDEVPIFVEGSDKVTLEIVKELAKSISGRVKCMDSEKRARLHLAAVFACNFANHCFTLANKELETCGENFSILLPLLDETLKKVHYIKPQIAQTGPAVRGDYNILKKHEMLIDDELTREIYRSMSQSIRKNSNDKL